MSSNKKFALSLTVMVLVTVLAVVTIVAVFAASQQKFTSNIRVRYTAQEVTGEATARWKVGNEDWQPMKVGGEADGDTTLTFGAEANVDASLSPTDKDIQLTSANPYVVFEYKFTNSGGNDYAIDLFYQDDETKDSNMSVYCLNSDNEISSDYKDNINTSYGDWTTTTITAGGTKYVYILASIMNIGSNASYSGDFQFNLDGKVYSSNLEFDGIGTITGLKNNNLSVLRIPSEINGTPVTKIAKDAIIDQPSLIELTIPDSVTEIEQGALNSGCENLKYISIPFVGANKAATKTPQSLFGYIFGASKYSNQNSSLPTTLTNVIITSDNYIINDYAFYNCSGLTTIIIPDGVTSIGFQAFYGCSGLTGNLVIPRSVESIGAYAFCNCSRLTGNLIIPQGVIKIGIYVFSNCSGFTGNLTIPQGVTSIGERAFYRCSGLTGNLTIPSSVESIGDYAFGCSGLTGDLIIPQGVTSIGACAFYECSGLTKVNIPSSVESIGNGAFSGCSELTEVTIESVYAYTNATSSSACGSLLYYAKMVRVLSSLVVEGHAYINETNFPKITTNVIIGDKEYVEYRK